MLPSSWFRRNIFLKVIFFLHLLSRMLVSCSLAATHLFVTHVGPCEESPPAIITVEEMFISTQNYDGALFGQFNITEDVDDGWSVKVTMEKCQDIRNTDTCDHFSSSRVVRAGCRTSHHKEEMYTKLFHHTVPQMDCPVRAGVYQLLNYPVHSQDNLLAVHESKISTSVFGYLVMLEGATVDRRKLFCVEASLQLLYLRRRNWLGKNHTHYSTPRTTIDTNQDDDDE